MAARNSSAAPLRMAAKASVTVVAPKRSAQVAHARRAHLRHGDLRVDIAADQRRLAAVGEDDALDVALRSPRS